jgi:hypothetical protein
MRARWEYSPFDFCYWSKELLGRGVRCFFDPHKSSTPIVDFVFDRCDVKIRIKTVKVLIQDTVINVGFKTIQDPISQFHKTTGLDFFARIISRTTILGGCWKLPSNPVRQTLPITSIRFSCGTSRNPSEILHPIAMSKSVGMDLAPWTSTLLITWGSYPQPIRTHTSTLSLKTRA